MELKVFRNQTQLNLTQNQPSVVIKQMNVAETKLVEIHCFENAHVQNYDYFEVLVLQSTPNICT